MLRRLAVFLGCLLLGGSLFAQSYQSFTDEYQNLILKTRWKLGPFRIFPTIAVRDVGYDDNLYFGSDEGDPKKDFTATLSPSVRVNVPLRNVLILYVRDNPEYTYYNREAYQRAFTNSYGAGFRYLLLGRFVLSGEYGKDEHRRRISSEFQLPANDRAQSYQWSLSYETARKTSLVISGGLRKIVYEEIYNSPENEPVSRLLDREERSLAAEAYYQLFSESFLFLRGEYKEYRFLGESASWRNASSTSVSAGLRFPVLGRMRGVLNLGYKKFDPKTAGESTFSGLVGNTGLDLRTGRFGFRLTFSRDLVFSTYAQIYYYIEDSARFGGSVYLTSFLKIDYDYSLGRADYSVRPAAGEAGRLDRHRNHSLGLVVRVFRTAGIGLTWNFERWTSTLSDFDRSRNFVGLVLTQSF